MVSSVDEKGYGASRTNEHSRKRSRHSSTEDGREHDRHHVKRSKHSKRDKKRKHRRKSRYDDEAYEKSSVSSSSSSNESSNDHRRDRKKRHKRDRHHPRHQKSKKQKSRDTKDRHENRGDLESSVDPLLERNHVLANELCSLFDHHPNFATELPIMLIRLGRGATFDLSAMTDPDAVQRLTQVFRCLVPFGVTVDERNVWSWKNPAAHGNSSANSNNNSELVLIRLVRALLDQIGLDTAAIEEYENPPLPVVETASRKIATTAVDNEVEQMTKQMLETFRESNLTEELAGICDMILEGEMINLDGVPDDTVRKSLEFLLDLCGLEKSEMEMDEDDAVDTTSTTPMGYGLPESGNQNARKMLSDVINVCQSNPKAIVRRTVKGPMLPDAYDDQNNSSDDDEEGPLPAGAAAIVRDNQLSKEQIKKLAARRAYELNCAKEGIDIDPEAMNGVREEWMVVPGKYDFLGSIQTGRSRTFAGKSKVSRTATNDEVIDPKIQAEIRAIREAYEVTRGPSLMDQHRENQRKEQQQQQQQHTAASWKWDRDKDLDAGRRVDKDALGMILGGAGTDLKNKFQSGI